ncbi:uncharacterized protein LOC110435246 [Sorghum bicolor]|uniref:uncharacterized protein LOC110435246 n=1 Tax=Sorghum bicolor TaxID=4558 RepID=UPI000B424FB2|nr:uncharacterized protein LOC110435246 [Sorghum bicolor]|eukprot:XP_021316325.1 uncharacterized protein LOC110435246 [Sorghum bicolor]
MERGQVPDNSDAFLNKDVDQQAATVGMLEHLSAPVVEAMQSPVAADDSNITNNTDVELQLGALLDNILHFARPLEKVTMEAIQDLIEHGEQGAPAQKKDAIHRDLIGTPGTPGLVA